MARMDLADIRREYSIAGLHEKDLDPDPFKQFATWFEQAVEAKAYDANAMTLATVDPQGNPNARIVLLKGFDERGFLFFTNYDSAKGQELASNPKAALVLFWAELERQVRVQGTVVKAGREESEEYFHSRPRGSQLSVHISNQGEVVTSREDMEQDFEKLKINAEHEWLKVPMPDYWGGYRVQPTAIEFWQGRPSRLHDRLRYRMEDGDWHIERLAP